MDWVSSAQTLPNHRLVSDPYQSTGHEDCEASPGQLRCRCEAMASHSATAPRVGAPRAWSRVGSRFFLVLAVMVLGLVAVAGAGYEGLIGVRDAADRLYLDNVVTSRTTAHLGVRLNQAHLAALELLLADTAEERGRLNSRLTTHIEPDVAITLNKLREDLADHAASQRRQVTAVAADWGRFQALRGGDELFAGRRDSRAVRASLEALFTDATRRTERLTRIEAQQAVESHRAADDAYDESIASMLVVFALALSIGVAMIIWLIRSVLPRMLEYVRFASDVADGDFSAPLEPHGHDEIAQLGWTLHEMARRRQSDRRYELDQLEFAETMQLTTSEDEAHGLLKRHLERSVPVSTVTVLNRNNSADRLEAMTPIEEDSALQAGLDGAEPRSCLSIRFARPFRSDNPSGRPSLLDCTVCGACPNATTCTPFLVSGEVIGSVLVHHESALDDDDEHHIRDSVTEAAPVLGNLRNLAIAELRAATDALTGLPNRRAVQENLKRMVAQASRTVAPLAGLMLDLDHFKQINDQYGHGRGDEVLAAVGTALQATMRDADFAGRYGGEEFLVLLPATDEQGAIVMAERILAAVRATRVPTVEQPITISIGIAVLPDHARDADSLERSADRALYSAKRNGRNRYELSNTAITPDKDMGLNPSHEVQAG